MMNKSYYISKNKKKNEIISFEYDKVDGYQVNPKVRQENSIEVSKIIFVKPEFSEKIIRKKIDNRIENLLKQLRKIEEDETGDEDAIKRCIIDAEKLRLQIINNYVKYLGHTYEGLTLKKIQIITEQLRYKLYVIENKKMENLFYYNDISNERESRRGR